MTLQAITIFDFNKSSDITNWTVINDAVMGGKSLGNFNVNKEGHGVFKGHVSLENNGGFSSVKYRFNQLNTNQRSTIILKVKGDGKTYQFRLKSKSSNYYSYITYFKTSKNWETITLSLHDMYPTFRGRKLDMPKYDKNTIEEISFLISNKKEENFRLEIDSVILQ